MIKSYYLQRNVDHSGMSGTGKVADVFEYQNFGVVLVWSGNTIANVSSVNIFNSLDEVIKLNGHGGDTVLVPQEIAEIENFDDVYEKLNTAEDILIAVVNEIFDLENPEDGND